MSWNGYERNVLMRNEGADANGTLQFTNVALAVGAADSRDARGMAIADFDNDGDLDVVINNNPGDLVAQRSHARAVLLRNDVGTRRNWLAVDVQGTQSNRDGVGAMVSITAGGTRQIRHVATGGSYASQHSDRLYFGLAGATQAEQLTVRWPSGLTERYDGIAARQVVHLTEGDGMKLRPLPAARPLVQLSSGHPTRLDKPAQD